MSVSQNPKSWFILVAVVSVSACDVPENSIRARTFQAPVAASIQAAPSVTAISPNSATANGGTTIKITGTGFVSGVTISIGGVNATQVTFDSDTSLTAITPPGPIGVHDVVVRNPDGQTGTLVGGYTYLTPSCAGDCYLEGSSPNFAQDLDIGTERFGPSGSALTLQFANGSSGFKVW